MFERRKMAISVRFRLRPLTSGKPYHYTHQIQLAFDELLNQKPSAPVPIQIRITVEGVEDAGFYLRSPEYVRPDPLKPWQGEVVTVDRKLWDQKEQKLKGRHADIISFNDELRKTELFIKNVLLNQQQRYASGTGPKPTVKTVKEEYMTGLPPVFDSTASPRIITSRTTLIAAYAAYQQFLLSQNGTPQALSRNSHYKWESGFNYLSRYMAEVGLLELKATEVNRNFLKRHHLWLLRVTSGNKIQVHLKKSMRLNNATDYCKRIQKVLLFVQDENIDVNPGALTIKFGRDKLKDVVFLSSGHIDKLMALEVDEELSAALWWVKLMCLTGLDYKDAKLYIRNRPAYERAGKEGWKIVINRSKPPYNECHIYILPALAKLLEVPPPHAYTPHYFNGKARKIAKLIGFEHDFTTKICRKTAGNLMLRHGFSMEAVSGILGHSNINTTQKHYVKVNGDLVDEEHRRIVFNQTNQTFSHIYKAS